MVQTDHGVYRVTTEVAGEDLPAGFSVCCFDPAGTTQATGRSMTAASWGSDARPLGVALDDDHRARAQNAVKLEVVSE